MKVYIQTNLHRHEAIEQVFEGDECVCDMCHSRFPKLQGGFPPPHFNVKSAYALWRTKDGTLKVACPGCDAWLWRKCMADVDVGTGLVMFVAAPEGEPARLTNWTCGLDLRLTKEACAGRNMDARTQFDPVLGSWRVQSDSKLFNGRVKATKLELGNEPFEEKPPWGITRKEPRCW